MTRAAQLAAEFRTVAEDLENLDSKVEEHELSLDGIQSSLDDAKTQVQRLSDEVEEKDDEPDDEDEDEDEDEDDFEEDDDEDEED